MRSTGIFGYPRAKRGEHRTPRAPGAARLLQQHSAGFQGHAGTARAGAHTRPHERFPAHAFPASGTPPAPGSAGTAAGAAPGREGDPAGDPRGSPGGRGGGARARRYSRRAAVAVLVGDGLDAAAPRHPDVAVEEAEVDAHHRHGCARCSTGSGAGTGRGSAPAAPPLRSAGTNRQRARRAQALPAGSPPGPGPASALSGRARAALPFQKDLEREGCGRAGRERRRPERRPALASALRRDRPARLKGFGQRSSAACRWRTGWVNGVITIRNS